MKRLSLWISFSLALLFLSVGTAFFPQFRIWAFAPFLAIAYHRISFLQALWLSFSCGLILDCLSSQLHFGLFSLNFVLVSCLLYRQKKHFFEEKPLALSFYSSWISFFLSAFLALFSFLSHEISFTLSSLLTDLVIMSFLDGVYAFFWFTCPLSLIVYFKKHGLKKLLPQEDEL